MGHDGGVFDQAFHTAQAFRQGEQFATLQETSGFFLATFQCSRNHAAIAVHLPLRQAELRMAGQAWVDDPFDFGMPVQPLRDGACIGAMPLHAYCQGFQPPQRKEAVKWAGDGSDCILQEAQWFGQFLVATNDDPADDVGMTIQVLGRRMQD